MPQAPSKRERKKSSAADKAVDVVDEGSEATIENKAVNGDDASGSVAVKEVPTSGLSKRKRKAAESWSKKSKVAEKAVDASEETAVAGQAEINPLTGEPAKKKRKPAEKAKDGEAKEAPPVATKAKRYTLFLGNLSFKTGKEEIEKHINDLTGGDSKPTAVRLQHDARTQKFKGFAFLDFANHAAL
jgi:nucleolar protein 6